MKDVPNILLIVADDMGYGDFGCFSEGRTRTEAIDPRYHPNARGFDEFVGFRGGWMDYYRRRLLRNDRPQTTDGRCLTDVLTDEAVEFLRRHAKERFFLHLAYNAPHFPFQAPAEEVVGFAEMGSYDPVVSIIYGMIRRMDAGIRRVPDELARLGIEENTLVMFTSDNGPQFGPWGRWDATRRDRDIKFHPERFTDICREPDPPRELPEPPPAQLYDLDADPGEQNDLAEMHPGRTARMLRELETWFESVEAERRAIAD